jgi:hypothetical protein
MKLIPRDLQKIIFEFVPKDRLSKGRLNDIIKPEIEIYNTFKNIWDLSFVEFELENNRYYKYIFRLLFGMSHLSPEVLDILANLSPTSSLDVDDFGFSSDTSDVD